MSVEAKVMAIGTQANRKIKSQQRKTAIAAMLELNAAGDLNEWHATREAGSQIRFHLGCRVRGMLSHIRQPPR